MNTKNYYRVRLGSKSKYVEEAYKNNFIGADYSLNIELYTYKVNFTLEKK